MVISSLFRSTADCPDPRANATDDRGTGPFRAVGASAGVLTPATMAAMATRPRVLPVLRILCGSSRLGVGRRHRPARDPGHIGPSHLLSRLVSAECSLNGRTPSSPSWRLFTFAGEARRVGRESGARRGAGVGDAIVGVVANPLSGRDIRRLVTQASVFPTAEKANMLQRMLTAFGAVGVHRVQLNTDLGGISSSRT